MLLLVIIVIARSGGGRLLYGLLRIPLSGEQKAAEMVLFIVNNFFTGIDHEEAKKLLLRGDKKRGQVGKTALILFEAVILFSQLLKLVAATVREQSRTQGINKQNSFSLISDGNPAPENWRHYPNRCSLPPPEFQKEDLSDLQGFFLLYLM